MRTAWASSLKPLGACLLAVMLCAGLAWPAHAITSNTRFTSAVTVTKETAYRGVLVVVVEPCTGLFAQDNPVDMTDPSGNDGDLGSLAVAGGISGTIDASIATVTVTAETAAEGTAIAAEATEVTETAVAAGETATAAEETVAKTTLRMLGKTVRGIIEQAKKIMNLAKESPEKVVPMPRSVIPTVCANITTGFLEGQPFELRRVNAEQAAINREKAVGLLPPAGVGKSWDEYPFASGKDPEFAPLPATVAAVPWWENSVQGGIIAGCYKIEDIKVGMPYTVIVIP